MSWIDHLIMAPVLLPLLTAAGMLLINERRHALKATLNALSCLGLLAVAITLLRLTDAAHPGAAPTVGVYLLGNWSAPFGIVLVADRLSAVMLTLTAVLALAALVYSLARWHKAGAHFHPLFQLLLMGLNGAFLTGDLFNLFVFFEVLLAASYGLTLHGSGTERVKAGLHYIAINLTASFLFLIGVALIYGVTGTLNMADLALRIPQLAGQDRALLEAGAGVLGIAFLVKAAAWPLCFWLPSTYAAASPPVAALFAILSKVGVYVILRLWLLLFGEHAGASAGFGADWLLALGLMTIAFGAIGALASQDMPRLAGYSVLVSSGTLLAVIGTADSGVTAAALYYLVSSTLALAAFYLLIELTERGRTAGADILAVTMEAFGRSGIEEEEEEEEDVGVAIPAAMALLGISFLMIALLLAGLPPLSGFLGKFALLDALFDLGGTGGPIPTIGWVLLAALLTSGLFTLIAMTRAGIRAFWSTLGREVPRVRVIEMTPIAALLLACVLMTVHAGPVLEYLQATAQALHAPGDYVRDVLAAPAVPGALEVGS